MKMKLIPSEYRRGLMIEVMAGFIGIAPLLFHLNQHYPKCDLMLKWLLSNRIKGKMFLDWVKFEHGNSPLKAYSYILTKVDKDKDRKRIILGKDFVS